MKNKKKDTLYPKSKQKAFRDIKKEYGIVLKPEDLQFLKYT